MAADVRRRCMSRFYDSDRGEQREAMIDAATAI